MIHMRIEKYNQVMYADFLELVISEGEEWEEYSVTKKEDYKKALDSSIVYLAYEDDLCIGYIRAKEDHSFGLYIYDLLVRKDFRGRSYGQMLINHLCKHYKDQTIYVMSDVDPYYESLGYQKIGSIFEVKKP